MPQKNQSKNTKPKKPSKDKFSTKQSRPERDKQNSSSTKAANLLTKVFKVLQYCLLAAAMLIMSDVVSTVGYYNWPNLTSVEEVNLPSDLVDQSDDRAQAISKVDKYLQEEGYNYPSTATVELEGQGDIKVYAPTTNLQNLLFYGISRGVLIGFIILYIVVSNKKLSSLGLTKKNLKTVWYAMPAYILYLISTIAVAWVASWFISSELLNQEQSIGFDTTNDSVEIISAFVGLVIIAPVAEELLFRGYLFNNLKNLIDYRWAVLISSVIFGLVHIQLNVALDTFVLAIYLSLLLYKTRNIAASILLHMIKNGVAFYILFIL